MNNLAILTTIYNHQNSPLVIENFHKFVAFINECGLGNHLYICEIIPENTTSDLHTNTGTIFTIHNSSPLWHKESGINFLLQKIPRLYEYIVVADNDIILNDNNWHYKTSNLLKNHSMVQCFETIKYVGPDGLGIDKYYEGAVKCASKNNHINDGNPGAFVAYRRDYLSYAGGLFDKCLVGGADTINIVPFFIDTHYISMSIFDKVFFDDKIKILNYIEKSKQFISSTNYNNATYIENCHATHQYHGMINDRNYYDRYNLINKLNFENYITQNEEGFYTINNALFSTYDLSKDLKCFFNNRSSSYAYTKPLIYNSNKYTSENNILWLGDNNCFNFRNINQVKVHFKKPNDIKYINITINGNKIDTSNLMKNKELTIEISEPVNMIIDADYVVPKNTLSSEDIRKLSLYIDNIQIISSDNSEYHEYPLTDVL